MKTNSVDYIDDVKDTLEVAGDYGLEVEVVLFALIALKDNPKISITEALERGLTEWDLL